MLDSRGSGHDRPIPITDHGWRDAPNWEGLYQITADGRVRSLDRVVDARDGTRRTYAGIELVTHDGQVSLSRNGEVTSVSVARLVAEAFGGER